MKLPLSMEPFPRMWDIITDPQSGMPLLRLGDRHVELSNIVEIEHTDLVERDFKGLLVMGAAFMSACSMFLFLVVDFGWRERFMLGAVVTGMLGVMSLYEAATASRIRCVELRISTRDGDDIFTTADHDDAAALEFAVTGQRI
jgi:hypothetical protein